MSHGALIVALVSTVLLSILLAPTCVGSPGPEFECREHNGSDGSVIATAAVLEIPCLEDDRADFEDNLLSLCHLDAVLVQHKLQPAEQPRIDGLHQRNGKIMAKAILSDDLGPFLGVWFDVAQPEIALPVAALPKDQGCLNICIANATDKCGSFCSVQDFDYANAPRVKMVAPPVVDPVAPLRHVRERAWRGDPIRIVLGAGPAPVQAGWIPTQRPELDISSDAAWKAALGLVRPDALLAEHVWEHLDLVNSLRAAMLAARHLETTHGYLRLAVPNALFDQNDAKDLADGHWVQYSARGLATMLQAAGFSRIDTLEAHNMQLEPWAAFPHENTRRWGRIMRSSRFDRRGPVSIILDASKPLTQRRPEAMRKEALRVLAQSPGDPDALTVLASHERDARRLVRAIATASDVRIKTKLLTEALRIDPLCCDEALALLSTATTENQSLAAEEFRAQVQYAVHANDTRAEQMVAAMLRVQAARVSASKRQDDSSPLLLCAFTLVLNGMPFLRHHVGALQIAALEHGLRWEWHLVEGVAHGRAHQSRPYARAPLPRASYDPERGTSIDGTSEYLDWLQQAYPDQIFVHRPSAEQPFWRDKLEMANRALSGMREPCVLLELDADELWLPDALSRAMRMMSTPRSPSCAYVDCHFFIAPGLVTQSRGPHVYSHDDEREWLRLWRLQAAPNSGRYVWLSHAPPRLAVLEDMRLGTREGVRWHVLEGHRICASQSATASAGIGFSHYAYVMEHQVAFKEEFYGYEGGMAAWRRLQTLDPPIDIARELPWVARDKGRVAGSHPVWADRPERRTILSNLAIAPVPLQGGFVHTQAGSKRRPTVVLDGVIFQLHMFGGILRLWADLLPSLARELAGKGLVLHLVLRGEANAQRSVALTRQVPRLIQEGVLELSFAPLWDENRLDEGEATLQALCTRLGASAMVSTLYTRCPATSSVLLVHDMIPEAMGWDLRLPEWAAKHRVLASASAIVAVSESSASALQDFAQRRALRIPQPSVIPLAVGAAFQRTFIESSRRDSFWLIVGQRHGYKGSGILFGSLEMLRSLGAETMAVRIVGGPPLTHEEATVAARAGADVVHLANVDSDEALANLYAEARGLLYLSLQEGFGFPVAEAMAVGCPVVLLRSNRASLEVATEEVAFVIENPTDPRDVAETLLRVERASGSEMTARIFLLRSRHYLES
ncbi:D-inositol-3-phosphate glycosyltransferase [Hondaea fermentalgiana]|uniref:D-inositol-3-phosphate glycosyltransferase n=1 Tax=Hondaea fermentalgiana TaxID=2315210 RepID=A0A2R5GMD5_9STRA|nr:D-inositol-3-phosphate glycosyltransferase [Hondaea fermentalgiana]|eukprot:GBG30898.1 D-inositol-3-phosphate glycosyltransferase [Hondaea fermentalgiana]